MDTKGSLPTESHSQVNTFSQDAKAAIDKSIQTLQAHKKEWAELPVKEYVEFIEQISQAIADCADEWALLDMQNRGIDPNHWDAVTSYFVCPILALRMTRSYQRTLEDIIKYGKPRIPGPVTTMANGQVAVGVFPVDSYDKIIFHGFTSEVWLDPGIKADNIPSAVRYNGKPLDPKVSLVLSAGNVSSTTVGDVLLKLFNERNVVMIKTHPVLKYTPNIYKKIFKPLIERGFIQIVEGGIPETDYIVHHADVEEIHMTGSDKTFDALLYGTGEQGRTNKAQRNPILKKKIAGELGNISPLIVVPGPWSEQELTYQADNIAGSIMSYCGFFCLTTRVIIQHASWDLRKPLLEKLRAVFANTPNTVAHYPGAEQRLKKIIEQHPESEKYGQFTEKETPWTFVADLQSSNTNDPCFNTEIFGSFSSETTIAANSIPEYIDKAVEFCNQQLWGTLSATIIIHPSSLQDEKIKAAVERAKSNLRYGTICINSPTGISYLMSTNIWGGYPGSPDYDIQSGNVHVNNAYMLEHTQKTVTTGPFKISPKPSWLPSNKKSANIVRKLLDFEKHNSVWNLIRILVASTI